VFRFFWFNSQGFVLSFLDELNFVDIYHRVVGFLDTFLRLVQKGIFHFLLFFAFALFGCVNVSDSQSDSAKFDYGILFNPKATPDRDLFGS
jgi:hypothetical protein